MKRVLSLFMLLAITLIIIGCGGGTETGQNVDENTGTVEKPKSATEEVIEFAKSFPVAAQKKDGKFFEANLADTFVGVNAEGHFDKAMVVKNISENPCDTKPNPPADQKATELADGIVLLTSKGSSERTCDGKTVKLTQNNAGLWVKDGDSWKTTYYQFVPTSKPEEVTAEAAKEGDKPAAESEAKKEEPAAGEKKEEAPLTPKFKSDDDLTRLFSGKENDLWAAWAKKDTKPFEEILASNFMEITAGGFRDRAATLKSISENKCEVTSSSISETSAVKINENFVIFTYKGMAKGTCDGKPMPDGPMYTSSIWMKDGENWKAVFHMSSRPFV